MKRTAHEVGVILLCTKGAIAYKSLTGYGCR